jgi:hypothetical protein
MKIHQYILEPYQGRNTRHTCPGCQQRESTFVLYIDTHTGEPIHPSVGRCNRVSNCGYHYTPKQYFEKNGFTSEFSKQYARTRENVRLIPSLPKPVSFIPDGIFKASLKAYEKNHFIQYLISLFGMDTAGELIRKYFIGSSNNWEGATVFWQIDRTGKIRTGKIMLYSPTTGKRVKEPYNHINWVHKVIKQPEFGLSQCLFGEHLLRDKTKPVAIVESEKTAIIASVYFPQFVWVAFGGIGFNLDKCQSLTGRTVILFPDLKGFDKWNTKAKELSHLTRIQISDLLERKATEAEKGEGLDLADYLIRFDFRKFTLTESEPIKPAPALCIVPDGKPFQQPEPVYNYSKPEQPKPGNWGQDIAELEQFFAGISLPDYPVKINPCTTILNPQKFLETHLSTVRTQRDNYYFHPFLIRLKQFQSILTNENSQTY